ncbi:anti-sigma factor [Salsipaludibacter albus]|uniref:anti-sigma factor n=1 Tax=Salsipaludibacter albus TaxID=2849650 RepID=UPI001EE46CCB|nr:anti-sigma factor [Salsipaludibacter albus]MBY5163974.1 anti-sigma factor [Salsipaludibacter albus]
MDPRDTEHDRWESLAVDHVLGGLDQASASAFRRHLVGCPQCKAQVAELRDLAGSLEDAARDERAVLALRTRARREVDEDDEGPEPPPRSTPRRIVIALLVIGVAVLGLAAHNVHLRVQQTSLEDVADRQQAVLQGLGSGLVMDTVFPEGASGVVVADGDRVAWSITDLPVPATDQRVVVWLAEPETTRRVAVHTAGSMPDGAINGVETERGAETLLVTRETIDGSRLANQPSDDVLAEADLGLVRRLDERDDEVGASDPS